MNESLIKLSVRLTLLDYYKIIQPDVHADESLQVGHIESDSFAAPIAGR